MEEMPSIELRDWIYNDIVVTFHESRPKFEKVFDEDTGHESEKVMMNEESPIIEFLNHGVTKINLLNWLKFSPQNPTYTAN